MPQDATSDPPDGLLAPDVTALFGGAAPGLAERGLLTWITLVGAINFELFGHLHNVVEAPDSYFDWAMQAAVEVIGLRDAANGRGTG